MPKPQNSRRKGYVRIAGVDEAGRGPLAGPVVAAACVLPFDFHIAGIDDSKKLSRKVRNSLYNQLVEEVDHGIGLVDSKTIDEVNILQATLLAMRKAIASLTPPPDYLLIDGINHPDPSIPGEAIIKGDQKHLSIAAASILAKEYRDRLMESYHQQWPEYGFDRHKGYPTQVHRQAIEQHGLLPIHRRSFGMERKKIAPSC